MHLRWWPASVSEHDCNVPDVQSGSLYQWPSREGYLYADEGLGLLDRCHALGLAGTARSYRGRRLYDALIQRLWRSARVERARNLQVRRRSWHRRGVEDGGTHGPILSVGPRAVPMVRGSARPAAESPATYICLLPASFRYDTGQSHIVTNMTVLNCSSSNPLYVGFQSLTHSWQFVPSNMQVRLCSIVYDEH